jgi:hypothetical protein
MAITPAAARAMTVQELQAAMDRIGAEMDRTQAEMAGATNNLGVVVHEMGMRIQNDRRPILQNLYTTDRAAWRRIWDEQSRVAQCPVCLIERGPRVMWDGPMSSDVPTRCPHFLCTACWQNLYNRHEEGHTEEVRCPICRDDVTRWAEEQYGEVEAVD